MEEKVFYTWYEKSSPRLGLLMLVFIEKKHAHKKRTKARLGVLACSWPQSPDLRLPSAAQCLVSRVAVCAQKKAGTAEFVRPTEKCPKTSQDVYRNGTSDTVIQIKVGIDKVSTIDRDTSRSILPLYNTSVSKSPTAASKGLVHPLFFWEKEVKESHTSTLQQVSFGGLLGPNRFQLVTCWRVLVYASSLKNIRLRGSSASESESFVQASV